MDLKSGWGSQMSTDNNCVNKFTNQFYRTLLGVPRHCSTAGTHTELGRCPILVDVQRSLVKYWLRIVTLPTNRLASHCYWSLFDTNNIKDPWINSIKSTIYTTGQYYIWNDQKSLSTQNIAYLRNSVAYICNTLKDLSIQKSIEKIASETKLSLLVGSKPVNLPANYLNQISSRSNRSLVTKLRLGTFDLEVEKGRRQNIPREERFCKLCDTGEIEDITHFVLYCPKLSVPRETLLNKFVSVLYSFNHAPPEQKVKLLFYNENLTDTQADIASDLLCCLKRKRGDIFCNL